MDSKARQTKAKKKKKGGGVMLFLLYGVGCAVGGAYVDRHHLSSARLWVGSQVQSLQHFGAEQAILGAIDESGLSGAEKAQAREDVVKVYEARRESRLSDQQLQQVVMAEVKVEKAAASGSAPDDSGLRAAMVILREVVGGL